MMIAACYQSGNNDDESDNNDKSDNNEDKVCLFLKRWDWVGHVLDHVLDHIIIGFVTTTLHPLSTLSPLLLDHDAANLRSLFAQGFDFPMTNHDIINKYAIHKINQYTTADTKDFSLWNGIQVYFEKFEAKHFNKFKSNTWNFLRDYYYMHGYWTGHNFGPSRNQTTIMLKAVQADWNNEWTLGQIK